jgi:hypothetical protein
MARTGNMGMHNHRRKGFRTSEAETLRRPGATSNACSTVNHVQLDLVNTMGWPTVMYLRDTWGAPPTEKPHLLRVQGNTHLSQLAGSTQHASCSIAHRHSVQCTNVVLDTPTSTFERTAMRNIPLEGGCDRLAHACQRIAQLLAHPQQHFAQCPVRGVFAAPHHGAPYHVN